MTKKHPYDFWGVECGEGWRHLYEPLIELAEAEGATVYQIKQKLGTLRFSAGPMTDKLRAAIEAAEAASAKTCEACGQPGQMRRASWIEILCDRCADA